MHQSAAMFASRRSRPPINRLTRLIVFFPLRGHISAISLVGFLLELELFIQCIVSTRPTN